ncbi:hypothetical protein [Dinghuibacter silviterrae]|uniref:Uncharacterized protein n=1 Tax=Dinghuibacter silviterrae TaxID=1539049 RepID=A0A4V3GLR4_9BACT|nr:hypothetical protein [Dinghuibacter silviterrae]TDX00543.1 hypothetical protein EDB95_1568 [Dinghuibacter silviterrae]
MHLIPHLQKKFELNLSGAQVIETLKRSVDKNPIRIDGRSYLDNPFVGTFEANSFVLTGKWRTNSRRRMFIPIATGKIESIPQGTVLHLTVAPPWSDYIFPLIFCSAILTLGGFQLSSRDTGTLVWAVGFTCMMYVTAVVAFNINADKYVRFLAGMLPIDAV